MSEPQAHVQLRKIVTLLADNSGWPAKKLPDSYLVVDTETLGVLPHQDRVIQVGFCLVKDGEIDNSLWSGNYMSLLMKLPKEAFANAEGAIKVHGLDYEKSQRDGLDPVRVMEATCDILGYAREHNLKIVGHNFCKFDRAFLELEMGRTGVSCSFTDEEILDTAMLVKAMQISILPGNKETSHSYWHRVGNMRCRGIYFNLDRYCMTTFGLTKYGAAADCAHDAGYDCYLTHLLVRELNKILSGAA